MSRSGLSFVSVGVLLVLLLPGSRAPADPASPAPPDTLTGLARRAMDHPGVTWREIDGKAVRVYYQPGTFGARHVAALTRSADGALEEAVALVDSGPYERPLNVFLLTSRDQMIDLLGFRATGFADWRSSSVFLVVRDDWRSFDLHEITHVVSMSKWGEPAEPVWWIREGLAVYADGRCRDHTVDELVAEYLRRGTLPTAADLIDRFGDQGELRGYLSSGSLVGYLVETYGIHKVEAVWKQGGDHIESVLGTKLANIDRGWRARLAAAGKPIPPEEWTRVDSLGCG
jgi:hypothetical protein